MVFIFNFGKVINAMLLAEKETTGFEFQKEPLIKFNSFHTSSTYFHNFPTKI